VGQKPSPDPYMRGLAETGRASNGGLLSLPPSHRRLLIRHTAAAWLVLHGAAVMFALLFPEFGIPLVPNLQLSILLVLGSTAMVIFDATRAGEFLMLWNLRVSSREVVGFVLLAAGTLELMLAAGFWLGGR
jgi:hypothetical protein